MKVVLNPYTSTNDNLLSLMRQLGANVPPKSRVGAPKSRVARSEGVSETANDDSFTASDMCASGGKNKCSLLSSFEGVQKKIFLQPDKVIDGYVRELAHTNDEIFIASLEDDQQKLVNLSVQYKWNAIANVKIVSALPPVRFLSDK